MSTATPTANELLVNVKEEFNPSQYTSTPSARSTPSDSQGLEVLVRLIVRDELLRQVHTCSPEVASVESTDDSNARRRGAALPDENASDSDSDAQVMSAGDVAAFLGVDRNTVYDYAGRGTIPCRRLGKRLLFHKPVLVSWLDPSKAASTRKA